MRRILRIGSLMMAAALLTGCFLGKDTTKIPVRIGFLPVIGHDTRAEESVPFPQERSFNVWALHTGNGNLVLDKENITYGYDGWLASKTWPEAELEFTAYWPTDLNPEYDKEKGVIFRNFKAEDVDLLVATERTEYESDTLVPLHFEHILSRCEFRVMHSLESNIEFRVTKIEMKGFGLSGDYNTYGDGLWVPASREESYTVYKAEDENNGWLLTNEPVYIGKDFYTIPQLCTAMIEMQFKVRVNGGEWIPDSAVAGPMTSDWKSGTQYTYTLNMTDEKLTYTTGISNWNNRE